MPSATSASAWRCIPSAKPRGSSTCQHQRFRSWARGYVRRSPTRPDVTGEAIVTALPAHDADPTIPFIGLAEGVVLAAIRRYGVPLQRIRPALDVLRAELGIDHALASRRLYTDGAELLYDYADQQGEPVSATW